MMPEFSQLEPAGFRTELEKLDLKVDGKADSASLGTAAGEDVPSGAEDDLVALDDQGGFKTVDSDAYAPARGGLSLPGVAGNYAATPHQSKFDITGDLQLRVDVEPRSDGVLIGKFVDAFLNNSYVLRIQNENLQLLFRNEANQQFAATSTVSVPLNVRAQYRVLRDGTTGDVTFQTRQKTEEPWVQFGDVVSAPNDPIRTTQAPVEVGSRNDGVNDLMDGVVYAAQVWDGTTLVASVEFEPPRSGWETPDAQLVDLYGNTWTLNGDDWEWS